MGDKENEDEKLPTTSSTVIECRAAMTSKLTLRPSSLQSAVHKNFALTEKNRNMKKVRTIAEHQSFVDPEKEKAERIQMKDDMRRIRKRRQIVEHVMKMNMMKVNQGAKEVRMRERMRRYSRRGVTRKKTTRMLYRRTRRGPLMCSLKMMIVISE